MVPGFYAVSSILSMRAMLQCRLNTSFTAEPSITNTVHKDSTPAKTAGYKTQRQAGEQVGQLYCAKIVEVWKKSVSPDLALRIQDDMKVSGKGKK